MRLVFAALALALALASCAGGNQIRDTHPCQSTLKTVYAAESAYLLGCTALRPEPRIKAICDELTPRLREINDALDRVDCELAQDILETVDKDVRALAQTRRLIDRLREVGGDE